MAARGSGRTVDVSTKAKACAWMAQRGRADFADLWLKLEPLCFNEHGWPAGITHVGHFDSLSSPALKPSVKEDLVVAYVYLAASFFCLDHLYDHESKNDLEMLAGSVLIPKALQRIARALAAEGQDVGKGLEQASFLFESFLKAMILEREVKDGVDLHPQAIEKAHVVGRSWLVIFTYKTIQQLKGQVVDLEAQQLLEDTIYLLQLGDDWGDWREDFRAGNRTSFIRECVAEMGALPANDEYLERYVYLSGHYERRGMFVASGLREIEQRLVRKYGGQAGSILAMVRQCRELAEGVVDNFVRVKGGLRPKPLPAPLH